MKLVPLLLYIAAAFNIGLGYTLIKKRKNSASYWFSLCIFLSAAWSIGIAVFLSTQSDLIRGLSIKTYYIAALLIGVCFYRFCIFFPFQHKKTSRLFDYTIIVLTILIVYLICSYGIISNYFINADGYPFVKTNIYIYLIYALFFLFNIVSGIKLLISKVSDSSAVQKKIIFRISASVISAFIIGTLFNLILPLFSYKYIWVGPIYTIVTCIIIFKVINSSQKKAE